jgi:beta-carotene 3-hydroxylase
VAVSALGFVAIVIAAFVLMEPITAATHRFVMHGVGVWFHRSHHRAGRKPSWERNDWFPVAFASIVLFGLWLGFNRDGFAALIPVAIGVTLYGATYALVHDGYIHRRLDPFGDRGNVVLDHLAESHRIHHLYNGAPYGMLVPIVPADLRARAATTDRDPFADPVPAPAPAAATPGGLSADGC